MRIGDKKWRQVIWTDRSAGNDWHGSQARHTAMNGEGDDDLRVAVIVTRQVQITSTLVTKPDVRVARVSTIIRLLCAQMTEESLD